MQGNICAEMRRVQGVPLDMAAEDFGGINIGLEVEAVNQIAVETGVAVGEFDGAGVGFGGFGDLPAIAEGIAEIVPGAGELGLKCNGAAAGFGGLVWAAGKPLDVPKIAQGFEVVGFDQ